jgi:prolyl oligopeptidase
MKPILSLTAACAALAAAAAAFAAVPPTEVTEVRDPLHGVEIVDPYRWLEGSDAPEIAGDAELDARVSAWTDAQNAYTREVLDGLGGRRGFARRARQPLFHVAA